MADQSNYEKHPPTAPPPYTMYPTGNSQPEAPQPYGFHPPPAQYQPYPQGYPPQPPLGYSPQQPGYPVAPPATTPHTVQPTATTQQTVVVMGGCPSCRVGVLEDDYTCCGILCAICFFPIGILCCLAMKEKRCTNCKASF